MRVRGERGRFWDVAQRPEWMTSLLGVSCLDQSRVVSMLSAAYCSNCRSSLGWRRIRWITIRRVGEKCVTATSEWMQSKRVGCGAS